MQIPSTIKPKGGWYGIGPLRVFHSSGVAPSCQVGSPEAFQKAPDTYMWATKSSAER